MGVLHEVPSEVVARRQHARVYEHLAGQASRGALCATRDDAPQASLVTQIRHLGNAPGARHSGDA